MEPTGGGLACLADGTNVTVEDAVVTGNEAGLGGGLASIHCALTLIGAEVTANIARAGGGVFATGSTVNVARSMVSDNHSYEAGGGIYAQDASTMTISDSTVSGNTAVLNGGGIQVGGDIFCCENIESSTITLFASTVSGNVVSGIPGVIAGEGGGMGADG